MRPVLGLVFKLEVYDGSCVSLVPTLFVPLEGLFEAQGIGSQVEGTWEALTNQAGVRV